MTPAPETFGVPLMRGSCDADSLLPRDAAHLSGLLRGRFVTADLYTCQPSINRERVVALLTEVFGIGSAEVYVQDRGVRYPSANVA